MKKECICTEWDGKGWSVCGFPCPAHNKFTKKELSKVFEKRKKAFMEFKKIYKKRAGCLFHHDTVG